MILRYRPGPSPCAQHPPQGAQERERVLAGAGEALPLLGSYDLPLLSLFSPKIRIFMYRRIRRRNLDSILGTHDSRDLISIEWRN